MKVELRNISKKYEGNLNYTLENLNLNIASNDFCVILGPSGCGKTTLLRMIAGLISITKGDLMFDSKRVNDLAPKDRNIAMVFQSYALYPHMNVYKNMAFSLKMKKINKTIIDQRVRDAASLMNLTHILFKKPKEISGGQRQRVALGRAIVRKPKLFLMDEPLSNLDAKLREKMRIELVKIHKAMDATTIYVTHDQLEAMTMATKIVLMYNQKIQQIGTPDELYNEPNSLFVANFIGSPTINSITGSVKDNLFISHDGHITYEIPSDALEKIKHHKIQEITLAVRSENIEFVETENKKQKPHCEGSVFNIESLGKEKEVMIKVGDNILIASVYSSNKIIEHQKLKLNFSKVFLFDSNLETRIK